MIKHRKEFYRDPSNGKVAGVCAGIADYFGLEIWLVRILVVSGVLFGMPFLLFGYVAAWFILDKKPEEPFTTEGKNQKAGTSTHSKYNSTHHDPEQANESIKVKARIWQSGEPPKQAFHDIRRKFSVLEKKLQAIEQYVTSPEFTVTREINKL